MNQEVILITQEMFIKWPPGPEQTSAEPRRPERAIDWKGQEATTCLR